MKLVVVVEVVVVLVVVEGAGKTCGVAMFDGDAEKESSARVFLQFPRSRGVTGPPFPGPARE